MRRLTRSVQRATGADLATHLRRCLVQGGFAVLPDDPDAAAYLRTLGEGLGRF